MEDRKVEVRVGYSKVEVGELVLGDTIYFVYNKDNFYLRSNPFPLIGFDGNECISRFIPGSKYLDFGYMNFYRKVGQDVYI